MDKNINKEMPAWLNTFVNSIVKLKKTAADDEDFDDDEEEIEDDEPSSPMDMRNDFSPEPSLDSFDNQMDDTSFNGQQEENFNSEININDLDTITWQDNEYKVLFNENNNTAKIINNFGNVVTILENVSNLNDVNDELNAKEIVVNIANNENKKMKKQSNFEDEIEDAFKTLINDSCTNCDCEDCDCKNNESDEIEDAFETLINDSCTNCDCEDCNCKNDESDEIEDDSKLNIDALIDSKIKKYIDELANKIDELEKLIKDKKDTKEELIVESEDPDEVFARLAEEDDDSEIEEADDLDLDETINDEDNIDIDNTVDNNLYDVHPEKVDMSSEKYDYSNPLEIIGKEKELFIEENECPECLSRKEFEIIDDDDNEIKAICKKCNTLYIISKVDGTILKC